MKTRFARVWTSAAVPTMSFTSLGERMASVPAPGARAAAREGDILQDTHLTGVMSASKSVHGRGSLSLPTSRTKSFLIVAVSTFDCIWLSMLV